ncbi:hypothetical protein BLNAU_11745 [Blattamonas nauphoetae]|uniref:Uncharacterized protein n=1 Tax=Blattamonas nauphoetae TaxID=2049346 RepID=A0ABQ9XPH4_9EUKA|nr:hypothetical protein BLNAU_11745 [Blattamonas nauphoetae]
MKLLRDLIYRCSDKIRLALVKADLVPQLINTLNLQYLFFAEVVDIRSYLMCILSRIVWLSTPVGLAHLRCKDDDDKQSVRETILDRGRETVDHFHEFSYQTPPNMSSLSFAEAVDIHVSLLQIIIYPLLLATPDGLKNLRNEDNYEQQAVHETVLQQVLVPSENTQQEWNIPRGNKRQMGKAVDQMLRMEGIEDASEGRLRNDRNGTWGGDILDKSISWSNTHDMNLPRRG